MQRKQKGGWGIWLPLVSPIGTLVVVALASLSNNSRLNDVSKRIDDTRDLLRAEFRGETATLRAEMKIEFANQRTELNVTLLRIENKIDHIAETVATPRRAARQTGEPGMTPGERRERLQCLMDNLVCKARSTYESGRTCTAEQFSTLTSTIRTSIRL